VHKPSLGVKRVHGYGNGRYTPGKQLVAVEATYTSRIGASNRHFPRIPLHYISGRLEAGSNTSTVALRVVGGDEKRSPQSETVKYGCGPRMTALARASTNCKRQTRPLVRESASHQQTRNCLKVIKIWS
jgi:hypothetical protein